MPQSRPNAPQAATNDSWFEREGHAERVLSVLNSGTPDQREVAANTLAAFEVTRAEPSLISCLEYPSHTVREAAARALGRCGGPKAVEALIDAGVAQRIAIASVRDALSALPEAATAAVADATRHESAIVRAVATRELGQRRGYESALVAALGDMETPVRVQAVLAFAVRGSRIDEIATQSLLARADDPEPSVRAALCRVLGALGTPGTTCLRELTRDADEWVSRSAEVALASPITGPRKALTPR